MEPNIIVAIDKDRKLRGIDDVKRGLACECFCAECNGVLEACKGEHRQYFRHYAKDRKCTGGSWESQLHLLSKYIIEQHKAVMLPKLEGRLHTYNKEAPTYEVLLLVIYQLD